MSRGLIMIHFGIINFLEECVVTRQFVFVDTVIRTTQFFFKVYCMLQPTIKLTNVRISCKLSAMSAFTVSDSMNVNRKARCDLPSKLKVNSLQTPSRRLGKKLTILSETLIARLTDSVRSRIDYFFLRTSVASLFLLEISLLKLEISSILLQS